MYTFYWLDGTREVLEGSSPEDALNKAGYGFGAIKALDFYIFGSHSEYKWVDGKWKREAYID